MRSDLPIIVVLIIAVVGLGIMITRSSNCSPPVTTEGGPAAEVQLSAAEQELEKSILESAKPVLVDFYATWCGPCQQLAPIVSEVADENPEAEVVKIDVDQNPGLAQKYGVSSIPTLLVFNDGQPVDRSVGAVSKAKIERMLEL